MNTTCEATVSALIGASDRLHDVATSYCHDRKQKFYNPKSALQKLLSMVEPIMRPLTIELHETEKEEYTTSQHSIDEIISCPGQRNSFQRFLQAHENPSCSFVKEFQFLCLCREFRDWGDKPQSGPYRIRVLANYIYHNFIREGGSQWLALSDVIRRNIERMRSSESRVSPGLFDEAYQYVSMVIIQQNVVKSFVESHYYQTMWDDEELDCNLFKALSLGGATSLSSSHRPKPPFAGGSQGSTDVSSCSSSLSRYSRSNFFGDGLSSETSSGIQSEIQSINSSKTGSSKSSTGSNASAAFDKYYSTKNSQKKSKHRKGLVSPQKLMEELLPRLEIIKLEQTTRVQSFGDLESGPFGADTPLVVRNRSEVKTSGYSGQVDISKLDHQTHHSLPFQGATLKDRKRSSSGHSVEAMICEEAPAPPPLQAWSAQQKVEVLPSCQGSKVSQPPCQQSTAQSSIQLAYTFGSDSICYGKVVPAPRMTLGMFKEVVAWGLCGANARYFFKRQIAGIGEIHEEVSTNDDFLPFWAPNTVFGRVERGPD